jgi:hypothetical protein
LVIHYYNKAWVQTYLLQQLKDNSKGLLIVVTEEEVESVSDDIIGYISEITTDIDYDWNIIYTTDTEMKKRMKKGEVFPYHYDRFLISQEVHDPFLINYIVKNMEV